MSQAASVTLTSPHRDQAAHLSRWEQCITL